MRKPNGYGSVFKLKGNRRKPYAVRVTDKWEIKGNTAVQKYKYLGYYSNSRDAEIALAEYNKYSHTDADDITLAQLWDLWYEGHLKNRSPKTIHEYEHSWSTLLPLHHTKMYNIDRKTLQKHIDTSDYAKNTARIVKIILSQMFEYAARMDVISPDKAKIPSLLVIDTLRVTKSVKRANFEPTEIHLMWTRTNEYFPYLILIYTGLRVGELLALRKEDVHIEEQYLDIKQAKTKAGVRQVPIADCILPLVKEQYDRTDTMFYPYTYTKIREYLRRRMKHSLHDTRHTFISLLTEQEIDPRIIKQIVGHAGDGVTENVYTHISIKKKLEAVNKLPTFS